MFSLPVIELSGTPYEIGFTHGSRCKKQVLATKNYYTKVCASLGISWDICRKIGQSYEEAIRAYDASLLDEMHGIADGADLAYEDILAINARSELTRMDITGKIAELDLLSGGCTAFALMPSVTADGKTIHAQTWDFGTMQRDALVLFRIRQKPAKQDILMITEGGLVGGKGMNSAGISLTLNALRTSGDPSGLPLHIVMRGMLNEDTITAAYRVVGTNRCGAAACITLAAKECAMAIEIVPGDLDVFYPVCGYVAHTNHVLSHRFPHITDYGKRTSASSYLRYGRCCALLHDRKNITLQDVKNILSDHVGYPASICMHADPATVPERQSSTNYGVIFDLDEKIVHLCTGNPCEGRFEQLTF